MLKYIEFEDKESTLSIQSEYTITSDEANEIKLVVNNIIDTLRNGILDNKTAYKYLKIVVPESIVFDNITIEVSPNESFSTNNSINLLQDAESFKIFSNGKYKNVVNLNDVVDSVVIQLDDLIYQNSDNFGRYWFSKNGSRIGEIKTFNLLVNDIQKIREIGLTPLILVNNDELEMVRASKAKTTRILNDRTYDDAHIPSAFVKIENANETFIDYCNNNAVELIDNDLVLIPSDCITYQNEPSQEDAFLTSIKAEFDFMGYQLCAIRKTLAFNNKITDVFMQDNNFNANESKTASIYAQMKLSQPEQLLESISIGIPNENEIVVRSGNIVTVKDVKTSTNNFIKIRNTEIPINVLANDAVKLTVSNIIIVPSSDGSASSSYTATALLKNGQEIDVTNSADLNVRCINSNSITCNKSNATISIAKNTNAGSYIIEFEYRGVKEYKKITIQSSTSKRHISTTIPSAIPENSSCQYTINLQSQDSADLNMTSGQNTTLQIPSFGTAQNGSILMNDVPVTHTALFNAKTEYDNIVYYEPLMVKLQTNHFIRLKLMADHVDNDTYVLSAFCIKEDGTEVNVTEDTAFSLAISSNDELNGNILTTGQNRAIRTIIVDGDYEDERGVMHFAQLPIFSTGFGFAGISIEGQTELTPDIPYYYKVTARYNDGTSKYVDADLSFNEEISAVVSSYESPTLTITPKKTLRNRTFVISAAYSEPGFGEYEHDEASLTANILGGFDARLSGTIGLHYGTNAYFEEAFSSDTIRIDSIEASDFKNPADATYEASIRTEITHGLINSINPTENTYQFVDFISNNTKVTVPFNMLTPEKVYIPIGTYNVKLYDLLSSDMCIDNSYTAEKSKYEYETGRTHSAINNAYISSFIQTGDVFKYYGANIYEYDNHNSAWVPISSRNNKLDDKISLSANINYKLEFIPISNVTGSINSFVTFSIHKDLRKNGISPAILAIENPTLGLGLQILDIVPKFKTSTNKEYIVRMNHYDFVGEKTGTYWITDDVPLQAAELVEITVVFAFAENV